MATLASLTRMGDLVTYLTSKGPETKEQTQLSEHDFEDFGPLLTLNDRVQTELADGFTTDELKEHGLVAPRVIVVGLTSAGKSSLLERVIGHSIFPVRDNVCTRRPFVVHLKKDTTVGQTTEGESAVLKLSTATEALSLPRDIDKVRRAIEQAQSSDDDKVEFNSEEIQSEIRSRNNEAFAFTDLPGIFLVSEQKMGTDFKKNRVENERLKKHTLDITKKYLSQPNTIVLVVISSTDWMHGMNNDSLINYLAEWLEEIRKESHDVPVYGVITKLDMQETLSPNSPVKKVLTGTLPPDHILHGLKVRKWIPVISSPQVLALGTGRKAAELEEQLVMKCLRASIPSASLARIGVGRSVLLRELKQALLGAIAVTHGPMAAKIDSVLLDLDGKIEKLPQQLAANEKRRMFDMRLKTMEDTLDSLLGSRGRHQLSSVTAVTERSLRLQLMVDAPAAFEKDMMKKSLRGDIVTEVKQIVDQALLEQGGSFDSDETFLCLAARIVDKYAESCIKLVDTTAKIVETAIRQAANAAFNEYPLMEKLVLAELGLPLLLTEGKEDSKRMFGVLKTAARNKVLGELEALRTMICFHPMWRNFDPLYNNILIKQEEKDGRHSIANSAEATLQDILELPALAKVVKTEGNNAITVFERETKTPLDTATRAKVVKHFARIEVMGYIIRMCLISTVFPLVLRDLRDGLFRGIKYASVPWEMSISSVLRYNLAYEPAQEKKVFALMEPSEDDGRARTALEKKRATLVGLKAEFAKCELKLDQLQQLFRS